MGAHGLLLSSSLDELFTSLITGANYLRWRRNEASPSTTYDSSKIRRINGRLLTFTTDGRVRSNTWSRRYRWNNRLSIISSENIKFKKLSNDRISAPLLSFIFAHNIRTNATRIKNLSDFNNMF